MSFEELLQQKLGKHKTEYKFKNNIKFMYIDSRINSG